MTTTGRGPDRHPERILRYRHNGRMSSPTRRRPPTAQVAVALLTVYIVWGSTYLAIAIMIESMPPLLSAGVRFVIAGLILMVVVHLHAKITRAGPVARPTRAHWVTAIVVGTFLLLGGNGGVVLAELTVPSGVVAVIIATTPIWLAVFDSMVTRRRPSRLVVGGLVAGLVGVAILLAPVAGLEALDTRGVLLALGAEIAWATGSIYSRSAPHPTSGTLSSGMSMVAGGVALLLGGLLLGELGRVELAEFTARSLIAFVYLVIFGSLAGYTAYLWLLAHTPVSVASTYAYVNPIVAVALGALILSEPITPRTLIAGIIIIGAVIAMVSGRPREAEESGPSPEVAGSGPREAA